MTLDQLLEQHSSVALQFSGGRDSLAMLLFLRPYWDRVTVYYCNSGDAFPETLGLVHAVAKVAPRFVEIAGRVNEVRAKHGWCSDVLQAGATWAYPSDLPSHLKLIDRHDCCRMAIMEPLHEQMQRDGVTLLLRGQRMEDTTKSSVQSGETVDGFTIFYPINDWTTAEVDAYIEAQGIPLPPYYTEGMTSAPDCMHCTAWLEHGSSSYLAKHHPEVARTVNDRLRQIKVAVQPMLSGLDKALKDLEAVSPAAPNV